MTEIIVKPVTDKASKMDFLDVPFTVYRDGKTFELKVPSADRRRFLKAPRLH